VINVEMVQGAVGLWCHPSDWAKSNFVPSKVKPTLVGLRGQRLKQPSLWFSSFAAELLRV